MEGWVITELGDEYWHIEVALFAIVYRLVSLVFLWFPTILKSFSIGSFPHVLINVISPHASRSAILTMCTGVTQTHWVYYGMPRPEKSICYLEQYLQTLFSKGDCTNKQKFIPTNFRSHMGLYYIVSNSILPRSFSIIILLDFFIRMKLVILFAVLIVAVVKSSFSYVRPVTYTVSGNIILPYGDINEPFVAYVDSKNNCSRIDSYNGLFYLHDSILLTMH